SIRGSRGRCGRQACCRRGWSMRTTDFSAAPEMAQATTQFVTGIRFTGLWSLIRFYRYYRPMAKRMKASPGFRGQCVWYKPPFTPGMMVFFDSNESLMEVALCPEHARGVRWLLNPANARASFSRYYDARPQGNVAGDWAPPLAGPLSTDSSAAA